MERKSSLSCNMLNKTYVHNMIDLLMTIQNYNGGSNTGFLYVEKKLFRHINEVYFKAYNAHQ